MVSFAGYPLLVDGRLVGVVALFARHRLSDETLDALSAIADAIAVGIDRDRVGQDRERLLDQLDSQRSLLEAVVQQMPSGLIVAEAPSGRVVLANRQLENILRHPFVDGAEVRDYHAYAGHHTDGRRYTANEWPLTRTIRTGEVGVCEEIEYLLGDGGWATVKTNAAPVRDASGRIVAGVVSFHDVTERRRGARRLAAQYAATRVLSDAVGGLSEAAAPLLEAVCEALGWDAGGIWELDEQAGRLRPVDTWHRPGLGDQLDRASRAATFAKGVGGRRPRDPGRDGRRSQPSPGLGGRQRRSPRRGRCAHRARRARARRARALPQARRSLRRGLGRGHGRHRPASGPVRQRAAQALYDSREQFAELAYTLQTSLLPAELPDVPGMELAARYHPAVAGVEVGGDFYDVFRTGRATWGVVMGDVCGKGAEAASLTGLVRYTIRAAAMVTTQPARILAMLNEAILRQQDATNERFATVAYASVARRAGQTTLTVACGGHPSPLVLRADGAVVPVGAVGTLLGILREVEFTEASVRLRPGDSVTFYTDGLTEAPGRDGEFGARRLGLLVASCAGLSAEATAGRLEEEILAYQGGTSRDDLAVLVLRRQARPPGSPSQDEVGRLQASMPSSQSSRGGRRRRR